jgi:serine/threonine protein phosphatase PrpC
MISIDE